MNIIKGLIKKDLYNLSSYKMSLLIVIIFCGIAIIGTGNINFGPILICTIMGMISLSTFSYDELNNSNTYIVALPYDRKTIVKSRYLLSLISIITAFLIGLILSLIIPMFNSNMDFMSTFASTSASIIEVILVIALLMPFFYKFGVQKGRIVLFIAIMGISLLIGIVISLFENSNLKIAEFFSNLQQMNYIMLIAIAIIIMLLILYISYVFSCKIYKNKEF